MHRCKAGELYSFIFAKEEKMGVRIISLFRFEFIVFCLINYFACTFCTFRLLSCS